MATFFGEVILPSSRVFFDDSDDEEDGSPATHGNSLEVKELVPGSLGAECNVLIISEGNVARGFSDNHLIGEEAQVLAEVQLPLNQQMDTDFPARRKAAEPTLLYKLKNSTYLLDVSSSIDILLSNNLTLSIESVLRSAKKIVVLCNRPTADYRCDSINSLPSAFLRVLKTSSWTDPLDQRTLEQPNFVSGLPASIVSWCEATNKPCVAAICYTDTDKAETVTVSPLHNFFKSSNLSQHLAPIHGPVSYKRRNNVTREESNMYL
uniref:Proteasome assembly chaperone 1 n=2 Tax=Lygus hesperus TaxID=30085 RepID=A0A0A9YU54_LYGHE